MRVRYTCEMTDSTNFFVAVRDNNADLVREYISAKGNSVNELDEYGYSPLYLCCIYGHVDVARLLLGYGADLNFREKENGWTPLHRSLYGGFIMLSLVLINAGACLDSEDRILSSKEVTPDVKKRRGMSEGECSAKRARDREGFTPMDLVSEQLSGSLCKFVRTRHDARKLRMCGVMSFGTADVMLGIPLPNKASDVVRPKRIEDALLHEPIECIAAARHHSMALTSNGQVYSWGHGKSGRLGHGNEFTQPLPAIVASLSKIFVKKICCGISHSLALTSELFVYSWGSNQQGQLGHGMNHMNDQLTPRLLDFTFRGYVVDIAAGDHHSLCNTSSNSVYSWGSNRYGQLGLKTTVTCPIGFTPKGVSIDCLQLYHKKAASRAFNSGSSIDEKLLWCKIIGLSAGPYSSMLVVKYQSNLTSLNEVYQWGHGLVTPVKVHFNEGSKTSKPRSDSSTSVSDSTSAGNRFTFPAVNVNAVQVAVGRFHYLALSDAHRVYTWHLDPSRLCAGSSSSGSVTAQPTLSQVESEMALMVTNATTSSSGSSGTTAVPINVGSIFSVPRLVEALLPEWGGGRIVSVAASEGRSCAVSDVGNLYTWDSNWQKVHSLLFFMWYLFS